MLPGWHLNLVHLEHCLVNQGHIYQPSKMKYFGISNFLNKWKKSIRH